jgi:predicted Zn-dependent protease
MALLLCAATALAPVSQPLAQVRMPALGDDGDEGLSVAAERRYGEQIMREVRRDAAYLDDPVLLAYVQSLWDRLVVAAERRGDIGQELRAQFPWELFLVRDRSVNAFALPGGYVGVHLGLVALTGTADELASVLAHELAHVSQRHIARSAASASRQGALSLAAMLLGVIAASRANSPDLAQAAIAGGQAAVIQGQLNFSREMEREADRIGLAVLREAGFAPTGMARMFEKLEQASRLNDAGQYPYLRTHPLTTERVAETRSRVGFGTEPETLGPEVHAMMQARARVLMDDGVDGLRRAAQTPATSPAWRDRLAVLYAAALAQSRLQEHASARRGVQALREAVREMPGASEWAARAAAWLGVEIELAAGDGAQALAQLPQAPAASGTPRPERLLRAQATLQAALAATGGAAAAQPVSREALKESAGALQTWLAQHRGDATAWQLLARHQDALGARLGAARAWAETRAALGDLGAAVDLLRVARRSQVPATAADFIDASVIDARLRELEAQRREIAREMRGRRSGPAEDGG